MALPSETGRGSERDSPYFSTSLASLSRCVGFFALKAIGEYANAEYNRKEETDGKEGFGGF